MYYININISFTINLAVTNKTVGDGEKLLTYSNSALKVLLGVVSCAVPVGNVSWMLFQERRNSNFS